MKALVAAAALLIPALAHAEEFHLACGEGSRVRSATTFGDAFDNHGNSAFGSEARQRWAGYTQRLTRRA